MTSHRTTPRLALPLLACMAGLAALASACGGSATSDVGTALPASDAAATPGSSDPGAGDDAGSPSGDSSLPGKPPPQGDASSPPDASIPPDPTDGTPTPLACTTGLGNGLTKTYGRLDGYLAAKECGAVDTHLHVQIRMKGQQYDVAINLDTLYAEKDAPMPAPAWAEGWHSGVSTDYPQTYGLHSSAFTQPASMNDLATKIEQELANVNHISLYATGYGPDGAHDVHRKTGGSDGVIVIHPLSPTAHMMMFRFSTDSF